MEEAPINPPEQCEMCELPSYSNNSNGVCRSCVEESLIDFMIDDEKWRAGATCKDEPQEVYTADD